jgi:plasmid stabilization system protein ParE
MKVLITNQAMVSSEASLDFYLHELRMSKVQILKIKKDLLAQVKSLSKDPFKGQNEPDLENLNLGHRRLIVGNVKIIYRVEAETIFITDFFDSRRNPKRMKP